MLNIFQVCFGACVGALARWGANSLLNPVLSGFALGTVAVNLLGSFIMGLLLSFFWHYPQFAEHWKLPLVTGFLGSFTTFSAYAGELAEMLLAGRIFFSLGLAFLEVIFSVSLVFLGIWLGYVISPS